MIEYADSLSLDTSRRDFRETAPPRPGTRGGSTISDNQFLGTIFSLDETVQVTEVGGDLGTSPGGLIFAAIIPVPGPTALPSVPPLEIEPIALASTIFSGSAGHPTTTDILIPLQATLSPGSYALIFGSELFGAAGLGFMGTNGVGFPDSVALTTDNPTERSDVPGFPSGRWNGPFVGTRLRFLVRSEVVAVPEPSTLALFGIGLAGLAFTRRRRSA